MINIPHVIDNEQHRMADALDDLLTRNVGGALDVATGYFNVGGFRLLADGLEGLGSVRLLIGDEPSNAKNSAASYLDDLRAEVAEAAEGEMERAALKRLAEFLKGDHVEVRKFVEGFLHAKTYLFRRADQNRNASPDVGVVGSSNLTYAGLLLNRELNILLTSIGASDLLRSLDEWFERQWGQSRDIKPDLISYITAL